MSDYPIADYYCVGDKDFITTTSVDEAVIEWYDNGADDLLELPEFVEVQAWSKKTACKDSKLPQWWLDHIIENMDENYGCEETWGDYDLSEEAKEHWSKFVDCIFREYPVSQLYESSKPFLVNVKEILGGDV